MAIFGSSFVGSMVVVGLSTHLNPPPSVDAVFLDILDGDSGLDMPPSVVEWLEMGEMAKSVVSFVGISIDCSVYFVSCTSGDIASLGILKFDGGLDMLAIDEKLMGELDIIVISFVRNVVGVGISTLLIPSISGDTVFLGILNVDDGLDMLPSVEERLEMGEMAIFVVSFMGGMVDIGLSTHLVPPTSGDVVSLGILKVDVDLDIPPSVDEMCAIGVMTTFSGSFIGGIVGIAL